MLKDFLKQVEQGEKGFDERPWEGCPPLSSKLWSFLDDIPKEKQEEFKGILDSVAIMEDNSWELKEIKKRFEFIFRMLVE